MDLITFKHKGDFSKTYKFFEKCKKAFELGIIDKYGKEGIKILENATPIDSGRTASSWYYDVFISPSKMSISWCNSNVNQNVNIALILQYGHGTGTGGYVRGIDYINPAMQPLFDRMVNEIWKEVISI